MNDLLSKTFSGHASRIFDDVDLESGAAAGQTEMASFQSEKNLRQFFEEVNAVKADMDKVKKLLSSLQSANEETKTVTRAQAMKALRDRMDKDVEEVLRQAKLIKSRLEELDKANMANRKIPGCEQGSSTDRTRMSITNGLRKMLKGLMDDFQTLRDTVMSQHRETLARRFYTVTGNAADEETIEEMISTGGSETFLQRAIQEQGRGQVIETIKEIQERHETVREIEKSLMELHQIFMDMAVLVEAQGEQLNNIEVAVQGANSFVHRGTDKLQTARRLQKSSRKWTCIAIILLLIVILVVLVPILIKFIPSSSGSGSSSTSATPATTAASPSTG